MKSFEYLDSLFEKMKLLSWEVIEKEEALAFTYKHLSKVEATLYKVYWFLDIDLKMK